MSQRLKFDVLIVGAGPVGMSMAIALKKFAPELDIAINDIREPQVPEDERSSALALGVTSVFEALDLWQKMLPTAEPIRGMHITDSDEADLMRPLFLKFEGDVKPGQPFAHMVPNKTTIGVLLDAARAAGIEFFAPNKIKAIDHNPSHAHIWFEDDTIMEAKLVIAADGARSQLREMAGIKTFGHDYGQSGIVATFAHEIDHHQIAYEHFLPSGPFATLPLPNSRSSLVWSEKTERVQSFLDMERDEIAREIEKRAGSSLGKITIEGPVQAFPLKLQIALHFYGERLALIGDAAHVVHPIAGQGMNLGLKDVAALAEMIIDGLRLGEDIGGEMILQRYEKSRRVDIGLMVAATEGLNRLFSNNLPPLRLLRDIGLGVVDRLPPLKSAFIGHAAAASGGLKLLNGRPL